MTLGRLALLSSLCALGLSSPLRSATPAALPLQEAAGASKAVCVPSATNLCLNENRFRITATWRTATGQSGVGRVVKLTNDTGYFWFFQSTNVEFVIKVLDACGVNSRYWVFAGGLTNVRVDITVEDMATGSRKTYINPPGQPFQPIQDTTTFRTCGSSFEDGAASDAATVESFLAARQVAAAPVTDLPPGLLLRQGRFRVTSVWRTPSGEMGYGQPVQLTSETGYFWFFNPNNVEMIVKLLDGCPIGGRFWAFAAGLTNLAVEITVEDLQTGVRKRYSNPAATAFAPIQDTGAFATCSSAGLPPDPGAAGRQTLAGIDSDHDGVRDDLQRNIAFTHAGSQPTIRALRQMVKNLQSAIVDNASQPSSVAHASRLTRDLECLAAIRPRDFTAVRAELVAVALDTEARGRAFQRFSGQLAGEAFLLSDPRDWASSCEFPVSVNALGEPIRQRAVRAKAVCGESPKKATVYFVNGVFTDELSAHDSMATLAFGLLDTLSDEQLDETQFGVAYNPTEHIDDLWEVVRQRFEFSYARFFRYLSGVEPMPEFMQEAFAEIASVMDVGALLQNPSLQRHIQLYKSEILEGRKVVLVPHSQGNFFANRAWDTVSGTEQQSLGLVSVANPDSEVADGGPYTTLTKDLVIRPLAVALPANTSNGDWFNLNDPLGHNFIKSYMEPDTLSRRQILRDVRNVLLSLDQPDAEAGDGIITVTLTWGAQPDVDLHVFEPGGAHVYYSDRFGDVGYLDVDDVTGFGPEHYFAACEDLLPGTYRVGLNYYRGNAPETANVQVKAGLALRSYQVRLNQSVGSAGDNSPVPVANIVVTGDPTEGFDFAVN